MKNTRGVLLEAFLVCKRFFYGWVGWVGRDASMGGKCMFAAFREEKGVVMCGEICKLCGMLFFFFFSF